MVVYKQGRIIFEECLTGKHRHFGENLSEVRLKSLEERKEKVSMIFTFSHMHSAHQAEINAVQ